MNKRQQTKELFLAWTKRDVADLRLYLCQLRKDVTTESFREREFINESFAGNSERSFFRKTTKRRLDAKEFRRRQFIRFIRGRKNILENVFFLHTTVRLFSIQGKRENQISATFNYFRV